MLIIFLIVLIVLFIFFWMIFTAPNGYEDEDGFHCGSPDQKIYEDELKRKIDDAK